MNIEDKIWLATVLDCEGSMSLCKNTRISKKEGKESTTYGPVLNITNTYYPMIERIAKLYPGGAIKERKKKDHLGKKKCYRISYTKKDIILNILLDIQEYMMEKQELALRLIDWIKWFTENRSDWKNRTRLVKLESRDEYIKRSEYVREVMSYSKQYELYD